MACVKSRRRFRRGLVRGLWGTGKKDNKQRLPGIALPTGRLNQRHSHQASCRSRNRPQLAYFIMRPQAPDPFFALFRTGQRPAGKAALDGAFISAFRFARGTARAGAFSSRLSRPLRGITPSVQSAQHLHFCHAQLPMRLTRTQALSRSLSSSGQCRAA